MRRYMLWAILGMCTLGPAAAWAQEGAVRLDTLGGNCFLYRGYAYLPLRSVARFLGAELTWNGRDRITIAYDRNRLQITMGSTDALFNGSPVSLPAPPLMVNNLAMAPVAIFHDYFYVEVAWDANYNRVYIRGSDRWAYCDVLPYTPSYIGGVVVGGAAPIGRSGPFFFGGIPFVSLLDFSRFLGLPVFFEPARRDFVIVSQGREVVFFVGSPTVIVGNQFFLLPASPVIVGNVLFVPASFFTVPPISASVELVGTTLRVRSLTSTRQVRVLSTPPRQLAMVMPQRPEQLGVPLSPQVIPGVVTRTPRPLVQAMGTPIITPLPPGVVPAPGVIVPPLGGEVMLPAPPPRRPMVSAAPSGGMAGSLGGGRR